MVRYVIIFIFAVPSVRRCGLSHNHRVCPQKLQKVIQTLNLNQTLKALNLHFCSCCPFSFCLLHSVLFTRYHSMLRVASPDSSHALTLSLRCHSEDILDISTRTPSILSNPFAHPPQPICQQ